MQVTISGGFHNRPPITLRLRDGHMSIAQYRRVKRHMCPVSGCICGVHEWTVDGMDWPTFADAFTTALLDNYDQRNGGYAK